MTEISNIQHMVSRVESTEQMQHNQKQEATADVRGIQDHLDREKQRDQERTQGIANADQIEIGEQSRRQFKQQQHMTHTTQKKQQEEEESKSDGPSDEHIIDVEA